MLLLEASKGGIGGIGIFASISPACYLVLISVQNHNLWHLSQAYCDIDIEAYLGQNVLGWPLSVGNSPL